MNEQQHTSDPQSPRAEVFTQLAEFLRQRNYPSRKCCPFLDRPIVLTIIGTVAVGIVTTWWQIGEDRRASNLQYQQSLLGRKYELLRTFPIVYQKSGNTVNNWLVHVLWRAEEKNKPDSERSEKNISRWTDEIARLQEEYPKVEPVDGILAQIEALFSSNDVRKRAASLRKKWLEFEQLTRQTNRQYNIDESLTAKQIETAENSRRRILNDVESLKDELIQKMGEELASAT